MMVSLSRSDVARERGRYGDYAERSPGDQEEGENSKEPNEVSVCYQI